MAFFLDSLTSLTLSSMKVLLGGGVDLVGAIVLEKLKKDEKGIFFHTCIEEVGRKLGNCSSFALISDFL